MPNPLFSKLLKNWGKTSNKCWTRVPPPSPPPSPAGKKKPHQTTGKGNKILQTKQLPHCLPRSLSAVHSLAPKLPDPCRGAPGRPCHLGYPWFPFVLAPVTGEWNTPWCHNREISPQIRCLTLSQHDIAWAPAVPGATGSCMSCGLLGKWAMVCLGPERAPAKVGGSYV